MRLLAAGEQVSLQLPAGGEVALTCESVDQRAWSRTAAARDADGNRWFLKQLVTRSGEARPDLYDAERDGAAIAKKLFERLEVLEPTACCVDRLVLGYPWCELLPFDELLRSDPARFTVAYPRALADAAHDLLRTRDAALGDLPGKRTQGAVLGVGAVFKGFELRNLALSGTDDRIIAFDLGRARRGPVEEAGARLFVSAALLDWGRPITRFARGPQTVLLTEAWEHLQAVVTKESCLRELDHQFHTRLRDDRWTYGRNRLARRAVVRTLGGRYVRAVRHFVSAR